MEPDYKKINYENKTREKNDYSFADSILPIFWI